MLGKSARRAIVAARVLLAAFLVLTFTPTAFAQEPAGVTAPLADDGALEVSVWYVVDYENCGGWGLGDLPATSPDALGLRNRLTSLYPYSWYPFFTFPTPQWTPRHTWANGNAWEQDWTRSPLGSEEYYIDGTDFAYFAGHGAGSGFFFGVGGNNKDDCQVTAGDTAFSWGTNDNDWIGLAACNVLDDGFFPNWANSINGTRLLMGFKTVMADVPFGDNVGWHLRWGRNFTQAWFWSADALLPNWQIARILAERDDYFYDTWANHNSATVVDNTYHWWTHQAGTPLAAADVDEFNTVTGANKVDVSVLGGQMPVFNLVPLSLEAAEGNFAQVVNAFGISETTPITPGLVAADVFGGSSQQPILANEDGTLIMDQEGGNYIFFNPAAQWNAETINTAAAQDTQAISGQDAIVIAETFLNETGLFLSDATNPVAVQDILSTGVDLGRMAGAAGNASVASVMQVLTDTVTNYKVDFERVLQIPSVNAATGNAGQDVDVSVVGPGPKLTVYVASSVPVSPTAAGGQDPVLAGQGGWRTIDTNANVASGQQLMATMVATDTAIALYKSIPDIVALDNVPVPAVQREVIGTSAGYYEGPIGMQMNELIPIYIFTVKATLQDNSTQTFDAYVPVNETYMAPYAEILSPVAGSVVPSTTLTLEAADASQTLESLGVGDPGQFPFVLGTGGDYFYKWYLGEVDPANEIGTTRTLDYAVPANFVTAGTDGKPTSLKFILEVTNNDKPSDPKVSYDEVVVQFSPVFLPTVGRK
jgi:hypothetical protein